MSPTSARARQRARPPVTACRIADSIPRSSSTVICPGAELLLPTAKVAAEPYIQPTTRDRAPSPPIDMMISGRSTVRLARQVAAGSVSTSSGSFGITATLATSARRRSASGIRPSSVSRPGVHSKSWYEATRATPLAVETVRRRAMSAGGLGSSSSISDPIALKLGDALVTPAERHPQVTLQLRQGLSSDTLSALQRGELDCGYVMTDLEAVQGLEIQRLGIADLSVVLPPGGLAQPDTPLAELVARPRVGTPPHCVLRRHLEALFVSAGREYREGALANTDGAVRSMVASGFGAGIVRMDQALQAERQGELKLWQGWRGHTWICWVAPQRSAASRRCARRCSKPGAERSGAAAAGGLGEQSLFELAPKARRPGNGCTFTAY
jgi:hypothetical protein